MPLAIGRHIPGGSIPLASDSAWPRHRPLILEGVRVLRGRVPVLDRIDLTFDPGRRYVVVGASGSGKSTLLRLLNRLEDPGEGCVRAGETDLRDLPVRSVRAGVGLVFQAPRPLPGTVAENLAYPWEVRGGTAPDAAWMAARLAEVGLDPRWLTREASGLSGGERQRLALAVAMGIEPEILALDEPTSALDPASSRRIADLLADRSQPGGLRTICVTHHRGHAPMLGDTAVVLDRGRVADVGPIGETLARLDAAVWDGSPREAGDRA